MSYQLASPLPSLTDLGTVSEGVSTIGIRSMFSDGDSHVHLLAMFGGDASAGWYGHAVNTFTGAHALVTGAGKGSARHTAYNPTANKLYVGTNYATGEGSLIEYNPVTQAITKIADETISSMHSLIIGNDAKVYGVYQGRICFSYDPVTGLPGGWKSYGDVLATAQDTEYIYLGADDTHVYVALKKTESTWTMVISPIAGAPDWTEWEFGAAGDTALSISLNENHAAHVWTATRTLADSSTKFYLLSGGTYTEIVEGDEDYAWSGVAPNQFLQGEYHKERWPYYRVEADDEGSYPDFLSTYNYDVDLSALFPVKTVQEYSRVGYRAGAVGDFTYVESAFTGPWVSQQVKEVVPLTGFTVLGISEGYNATFNLDYPGDLTTYLGGHIISPYAAMKHSNGEVFSAGYPNKMWRFNTGAAWTLTSANSTPTTPDDESKPNPYLTTMAGKTYHYRHALVYDANGVVWVGGNTTREATDDGNVMWYDPTDGSNGLMFPAWEAAGTLFRSLCHCLSRSKILVSDNADNLYRIDATTKAVEGVTINPIGEGSKSYMIEVSNDRVLCIIFYAGPTYRVGLLQPSDMTWVVSPQALGVVGVPFGFSDSQYDRMNYKLELGPDGYVWMFVGSSLYRVDPATCVFSKVSDTTYGKLNFAPNNKDLILYNINGTNSVKYYPGILRQPSRVVAGTQAAKVGGVTRPAKVSGVTQ